MNKITLILLLAIVMTTLAMRIRSQTETSKKFYSSPYDNCYGSCRKSLFDAHKKQPDNPFSCDWDEGWSVSKVNSECASRCSWALKY